MHQPEACAWDLGGGSHVTCYHTSDIVGPKSHFWQIQDDSDFHKIWQAHAYVELHANGDQVKFKIPRKMSILPLWDRHRVLQKVFIIIISSMH